MKRARARLSARRPLAWSGWLPATAVGLLLGQGMGGWFGSTGPLLAVSAATAAPAVLSVHRALGTALVLGSSAAALGAVQAWRRDGGRAEHEARLPAGPVELRGRVDAVRRKRGRGESVWVALEVVLTEPAPGLERGDRVRLAVWNTQRAWRIGDQVAFRASVRSPRGFCNGGDDGYARSCWRHGVVALASVASDRAVTVAASGVPWADPSALIGAARDGIAVALAAAVDGGDERAVLAALIFGDQSAIRADLRRAYARTGTAHVLSVSGLHIALVAMTAFLVLQWLLVRWPWFALRLLVARFAACAALAPAASYALLSGGAVATVRALVMGALGLGAIILLRRAEVWTALAAAALLLSAFDPDVGSDPSFQLSFASVAALVVASRRFQLWRERHLEGWFDPSRLHGRLLASVLGALVVSAAASIVTGPITSFHFGSIALLGVLANLIVVPLVGWLVLLLALVGSALIPVSDVAAQLFLGLAGRCLEPGNRFVEWLAGWRWCALDFALAAPLQVTASLAIIASWALPRGRMRTIAIGIFVVASAAWLVGDRALVLDPRLEIHFLDVGQGDATIVRLPAKGGAIVVDSGGLGGSSDPGERVVVPSLWRSAVTRLTAIALSHPEYDHYGGLVAVVRALPVDAWWSNGRTSTHASFTRLTELLAERGVAIRQLASGARPLAGPAGETLVLHPADILDGASDNDASLVLRVSYGATRVLLTGDIEAPAEASLGRRPGDLAATVVKVPHHGSRTSSTREFVAATRPGVAVAMLGANNRFAFPAPEVRARYLGMGADWRQTDRDGEVVVTSDGQLERVATCR